MWMTSCTGSAHGGFWGFWKKLSFASEEDGWLSLARRGLVSGAHVVWGRWKSQVYLSPYVEKLLNSKVIKSFVPELRSRKCFLCFGIPMFYVYMLWTVYVRFPYSCIGMLHLFCHSIPSFPGDLFGTSTLSNFFPVNWHRTNHLLYCNKMIYNPLQKLGRWIWFR